MPKVDHSHKPLNVPKEPPIHVNENGFQLYSLPEIPEAGAHGIAGSDSLGKTTSLLLLAGKIDPSKGWYAAVTRYGGTRLGEHLKRLEADNTRVSLKPQDIARLRHMPDLHKNIEDLEIRGEIASDLGITDVPKIGELEKLDAAELQLVAIAAALSSRADIYLLDEPTNFLDIRQKMRVAALIRKVAATKPIIIADHDIAFLDFTCDTIQILYGEAEKWSALTETYPAARALGYIVGGYIPEKKFTLASPTRPAKRMPAGEILMKINGMRIKRPGFELRMPAGEIRKGGHIAVIGEKGLGRSSLLGAIAGEIKPASGEIKGTPAISLKPQHLSVRNVKNLMKGVPTELIKSIGLERLMGRGPYTPSEGERQKLAVMMCLAKEADLYIFDEPSQGLDILSRLAAARLIAEKPAALVTDHDIFFLASITEDAWLLSGKPGQRSEVTKRQLPLAIKSLLKEFGLEPHKQSPLEKILR